jgi:hypothetical protein
VCLAIGTVLLDEHGHVVRENYGQHHCTLPVSTAGETRTRQLYATFATRPARLTESALIGTIQIRNWETIQRHEQLPTPRA